MSNVPKAREEVREAMAMLGAILADLDKLQDAVSEMVADVQYAFEQLEAAEGRLVRKAPVRKASVQSVKLTPKLAKEIRSYAKKHKILSFAAIAQKFNVNPGRVSEVLNGKK